MTKEARDLIEQVKKDIHDGMPQEAFNSLLEGICIYCRKNDLQDDCLLAYVLVETLDEAIGDAIKQFVTLEDAKRIINNHE